MQLYFSTSKKQISGGMCTTKWSEADSLGNYANFILKRVSRYLSTNTHVVKLMNADPSPHCENRLPIKHQSLFFRYTNFQYRLFIGPSTMVFAHTYWRIWFYISSRMCSRRKGQCTIANNLQNDTNNYTHKTHIW